MVLQAGKRFLTISWRVRPKSRDFCIGNYESFVLVSHITHIAQCSCSIHKNIENVQQLSGVSGKRKISRELEQKTFHWPPLLQTMQADCKYLLFNISSL